ncbi:tyrosine-type recombinase/integrase [Azospirillum canadense]|uniref:tyrosine-type recombinase/integrase n=1 Tax=Azospirillum canadense TaxID=403962 RepID=UPI0022260270|nr:site-specific integrase [Azospirillum canadense]MCW2236819.1 integrase [Azospirillum canadense]
MPRTTTSVDPATGLRLPTGVECRGDGQYRARKLIDGSRHSQTFATAAAARAWLEEVSVDARRNAFRDLREARRTTLRDVIDRYEREALGANSELLGAQELRTGHLPTIRADPVCDITMARLERHHIAQFRNRMRKAGYAKATIVRRLNILAKIIRYAIQEFGLGITDNPASSANVARPAYADVCRDRRLVGDEEERLIAAMETSCNSWDVWLVRWAIAQAMRRGETFALRWCDIDQERRVVTVHGRSGIRNKNGSVAERRPLMPEAIAILQQIPHGGPNDPVFPAGPRGAFSKRFERLVAAAGIADLTYHDLRHEATSRLAKRYNNKLDLMRVTGHRTLKSLNRYYNVQPEELAWTADRHARRSVARQAARAAGRPHRFSVAAFTLPTL